MASVVKSPDELNDMQQQLMVAAMENRGRLEIRLRSDSGRAVRGKDKVAFFDAEDSDVAGQFIDALRDLERKSLFRQEGSRGQCELTNIGWLVGRKLCERA